MATSATTSTSATTQPQWPLSLILAPLISATLGNFKIVAVGSLPPLTPHSTRQLWWQKVRPVLVTSGSAALPWGGFMPAPGCHPGAAVEPWCSSRTGAGGGLQVWCREVRSGLAALLLGNRGGVRRHHCRAVDTTASPLITSFVTEYAGFYPRKELN